MMNENDGDMPQLGHGEDEGCPQLVKALVGKDITGASAGVHSGVDQEWRALHLWVWSEW